LVAGDQDVRECQQPGEGVILDHLVGEVLEEKVRLFLVDIEPERADLPRPKRSATSRLPPFASAVGTGRSRRSFTKAQTAGNLVVSGAVSGTSRGSR
jgi:hypothetical protein